MASRFAVTGTGSWDSTNSGIWATTSGGASGASAPTIADDVFLDANSPAVTIASGAVGRSLNCTGYTNTLTHTAVVNLSLGDGTAGASNIALKFVAGMTYTLGNATSSQIFFTSSSATQQTIDYGGKTTGGVAFNGVGGNYIYSSGHTIATTATLALNQGTLNINGQTCSWGLFNSSNSNTRTLTLGASNITITGANGWTTQTTTGLTFNANTSTITFSASSSTLQLGTLTYNNVSFTGAGSIVLGGAPTFANLTRTGTAAKTDSFTVVTMTVTGTLTLNANSAVNRLLVQSNGLGTARTITAANVVITNIVDFMDITGAGAATWTVAGTGATALGDCGGNSGITFTTPATQTWSGTSGGNWSANAWTTRVPLPQDNVVINAAFSASQTVTADMPRLGASIDWTGTTGTPAWSFSVTNSIFGSVTLIAGMTLAGVGATSLQGRGSFTITMAGGSYTQPVTIAAASGTYQLQDTYTSVNNFLVNNGTFDSNNKAMTVLLFNSSNGNTRTVTLGTSTITVTSTVSLANVINFATSTGLTLNASTATFVISTATANTRNFQGGGQTFGTLTYTVAGSTGMLVIVGANTFNTINFSDASNARTLQFTSLTTTTITTAFNVTGTAGNLMTINSSNTASPSTLSKPTDIISCDYLSIKDSTATGGATWYAGVNSTNVSGNSGWIFTAPPVASGSTALLMGVG